MDLDTEGGDILLLELAGQVTLDESGLAGSTVANEDKLESGDVLSRHELSSLSCGE